MPAHLGLPIILSLLTPKGLQVTKVITEPTGLWLLGGQLLCGEDRTRDGSGGLVPLGVFHTVDIGEEEGEYNTYGTWVSKWM